MAANQPESAAAAYAFIELQPATLGNRENCLEPPSLTGVMLIDIRAGLFAEVLDQLNRTGLLENVRANRFSLALLHLLGPSAVGLSEMAAISEKLSAGASSAGEELRQRGRLRRMGCRPTLRRIYRQPGRPDSHRPASRGAGLHRGAEAGAGVRQLIEKAESRILVAYVRA